MWLDFIIDTLIPVISVKIISRHIIKRLLIAITLI